METSLEHESDNEFPELPPTIMLDLGLDDDFEDNQTQNSDTLTTGPLKDNYPPNFITEYHSDSTSSASSEGGENEETTSYGIQGYDERETEQGPRIMNNHKVSIVIANIAFLFLYGKPMENIEIRLIISFHFLCGKYHPHPIKRYLMIEKYLHIIRAQNTPLGR